MTNRSGLPLPTAVQFADVLGAFPYLPDTAVVRSAFEHARNRSPAYLFNHVVRSWIWALSIARKINQKFDSDVVSAATLLHDVGLTAPISSTLRFEVSGANTARDFVRSHGFDAHRQQLVWDAIALHTSGTIAVYKEPEVALTARGIGVDFGRDDFKLFTTEEMRRFVEVVPRLKMKAEWKTCLCGIAHDHPETTYHNVIREWGERFVPDYKVPSVVDFMMAAPFAE
jgi:hypothetical protein